MIASTPATGDEATERVLGEVLAEHEIKSCFPCGGMRFNILCRCGERLTEVPLSAHDQHRARAQAVALRGLPDAREGEAGHSSGGTGHDHMTAAEIQERHDLRARVAHAEQQVAAVEALAAEWDDDNGGNWCGDCDRSDQLRAALAAPPTEPDNEPTALAWTSDEEIERGQAALRESHPEVWQAWLDRLAAPPTETTAGSET